MPTNQKEHDMSDKLTGEELEKALADRNLPSDGTADEKRDAVAAFDAAQVEADSVTPDEVPAEPIPDLPASPSGFYRVRHPLFGEYSTRRPNLGEVSLLDKPAADRDGRPLSPKPLSSAATEVAVKKIAGAEPAANDPEEGSK